MKILNFIKQTRSARRKGGKKSQKTEKEETFGHPREHVHLVSEFEAICTIFAFLTPNTCYSILVWEIQ